MEYNLSEFFTAIERGDIIKLVQLLTNEDSYSVVNRENEEGKTPFQKALEMKEYEIAQLLIENGIELNTTLLRMVECNNPAAVTFICEHKDMLQEHGQNIMESVAENDEYTVEATPLLIAAENNNYPIVKILMKYGARMWTYDEVKKRFSHLPTTQLTRVIYRYYNAISSEAYLLQTNGNLLTDIFKLFKDIKRAKREKKGMNDEFETLTGNLECVSRKVLDLTRNEDEVHYLLAGDETSGNTATCITACTRHHTIPPFIKESLLMKVKGFLAHDKCQASLTDLWYQGFGVDVRQSVLTRIAIVALLTCLYPVLCILYIVIPYGPIRRVMRAPFVKFHLHTASRLAFLGFLIYATVEGKVSSADKFKDTSEEISDEELRDGYLQYRGANLNQFGPVVIFTFIAGMTLREINDIRRMGRKMYVQIGFSKTDILQLLFYWIYIVLSVVSIIKAHQNIQEEGFLNRFRPQTVSESDDPFSHSASQSVSSVYQHDQDMSSSSDDASSGIGSENTQYDSLGEDVVGNTSRTTEFSPTMTTASPTTSYVVCYEVYSRENKSRSEDNETTVSVPALNMTIINVTMNIPSSNETVNDANNTADGLEICAELELEIFKPECELVREGFRISEDFTDVMTLSVAFAGESRYNWSPFDDLLIAEASFALANILTFGRLLQTVVMISGRLGILAISLFGMVADIFKFLILFAMTLVSFALGMTQLYRPFDVLKLKFCEHKDDCPITAFISLIESMKTLFWALFGLSDLEVLHIANGDLKLTEALGHFMFALYLLVAVIVLLNALIAMMSSTYTRVQENAEKEWKYCRSTMMTEYILEGAVLPPPFNLIPDVWLFLSYFLPKKQNKPCIENGALKNHDDNYKETNIAVQKRYIYELQRTARRKLNQRCMKC